METNMPIVDIGRKPFDSPIQETTHSMEPSRIKTLNATVLLKLL